MLINIEKYNNIKTFYLDKNKKLFITDINNNLKFNEEILYFNIDGQSFFLTDDFQYFEDMKGISWLIKSGKKQKAPGIFFENRTINNLFIIKKNSKRVNRKWEWELALFNPHSFKCDYLNTSFKRPIYLAHNKKIFVFKFDKTILEGISIKNKEKIWQFNLTQLSTFKDSRGDEYNYKVEKFIGIWKNQLLVACNNSLLLALDVETGKLLHQWQYFKKPENIKAYRNDKLPEAYDFQLDTTNNKLIASAYYSYLEIDLNTKEIQVIDLKEQLEEHGILSFNSTLEKPFSDTHMFSTVIIIKKPGNIFKNGLVAINRQTKKIDWFYTDEIFGTGTNSPKLAGDKLYQLTLDGKLYIFEKE